MQCSDDVRIGSMLVFLVFSCLLPACVNAEKSIGEVNIGQHGVPEVIPRRNVVVAPAGLMRFERPVVFSSGNHEAHEDSQYSATAPTGNASTVDVTASLIANSATFTGQHSKAKKFGDTVMTEQSPRHHHALWTPPPDPAEESAREMQRLRDDSASAHRLYEETRELQSLGQEGQASVEESRANFGKAQVIQAEASGSTKRANQNPARDAIVAVHDPKGDFSPPHLEPSTHPHEAEDLVAQKTAPTEPQNDVVSRSLSSTPLLVPSRSPISAVDMDAKTKTGTFSRQPDIPETELSSSSRILLLLSDVLARLDQRPYLSAFCLGLFFTALFLAFVLWSRSEARLRASSAKLAGQQQRFQNDGLVAFSQQQRLLRDRDARPKRRLERPFAMPFPPLHEERSDTAAGSGHTGMAASKARARPITKLQDTAAMNATQSPTTASSSASSAATDSSGAPSTATVGCEVEEGLMGGALSRIQASFGGFHGSAEKSHPVAGETRRPLRSQQKIVFTCDVLEGRLGGILPEVGRLEPGCDPYVECRIVRGDPTYRTRGDVDRLHNFTAQTEAKRNDLNPKWNQALAIPGAVFSEEAFVQLVLWDYDSQVERSYALGHFAVRLDEALAGCTDEGREGKHDKIKKQVFLYPVHQGELLALEAQLTVCFGFWEAHRYRLHVVSGSALPRVKSPGKISGYIEARVVRGDPFKKFRARPGGECVWSARTTEIRDNPDPEWDQEFTFALACGGDPSLSLQLILWDSNLLSSKTPDMPVGHSVIKLDQITSGEPGETLEHKLKLARLPSQRAVADISHTELLVKTSFYLEFAG